MGTVSIVSRFPTASLRRRRWSATEKAAPRAFAPGALTSTVVLRHGLHRNQLLGGENCDPPWTPALRWPTILEMAMLRAAERWSLTSLRERLI
jgi:hypothetical protein